MVSACDRVDMLAMERYSSQREYLTGSTIGYNDPVLDLHRMNSIVHKGLPHKFCHGCNECVVGIYAMECGCS